MQKIRGLFVTIAQVIKYAAKTGQIVAEKDVIETRLTICRNCENLTGSKCFLCGCNMPVKVGLKIVGCPIRKW